MVASEASFNTLDYYLDLVQSGISENQAEAITQSTVKAFNQLLQFKEIATRKDLDTLEKRMKAFIVTTVSSSIFLLGSLQTLLHFSN